MNRKSKFLYIATPIVVIVIAIGYLSAGSYISSKVSERIALISPRATNIKTSIPVSEIASDITSPYIQSAQVQIGSYKSSQSTYSTKMNINLRKVSKAKPFQVDSIDVSATISTKTLETLSGFPNARVVNGLLQVDVGGNGIGKANLAPKVSNDELYFELVNITLFGSEIPASTLPVSIQSQIKSKSLRKMNFPAGLKMTSVKLNTTGLVVTLHGKNFSLGNLNQG